MMDDPENLAPNDENQLVPGLLKKSALSNRGKWYSPRSSPLPSRVKSPGADVPTLMLTHFAQIPRISFGNVKVGSCTSKRLIAHNPNPLPQSLTFEKALSAKGFCVSSRHSVEDDSSSTKATVEIEPDDDVGLEITWEPKEPGNFREVVRFMWEDCLRLQVIVFGTVVAPKKSKAKKKSVLQPSQSLNKAHEQALDMQPKPSSSKCMKLQDVPIVWPDAKPKDTMMDEEDPDGIFRRGTYVIKKSESKIIADGQQANSCQDEKESVKNQGLGEQRQVSAWKSTSTNATEDIDQQEAVAYESPSTQKNDRNDDHSTKATEGGTTENSTGITATEGVLADEGLATGGEGAQQEVPKKGNAENLSVAVEKCSDQTTEEAVKQGMSEKMGEAKEKRTIGCEGLATGEEIVERELPKKGNPENKSGTVVDCSAQMTEEPVKQGKSEKIGEAKDKRTIGGDGSKVTKEASQEQVPERQSSANMKIIENGIPKGTNGMTEEVIPVEKSTPCKWTIDLRLTDKPIQKGVSIKKSTPRKRILMDDHFMASHLDVSVKRPLKETGKKGKKAGEKSNVSRPKQGSKDPIAPRGNSTKGFLVAKKPKTKLKMKLAAKGVPQRRLKLVRAAKAIPRHPMPFAAKNMYYDERWIEKQQEGFARWLNFVLTPPDCDVPSQNTKQVETSTVCIGTNTKKSQPLAPSKEVLSLRAYTARRRMARLRRCACLLYQSEPLVYVIRKVESEVEAGRLAIRADRKLHADLGIKRYVVDMILSYNPLWLRIGLEVIYGEVLPVVSNDDTTGLCRFISDRLLGNPDIAREFAHPKVPGLFRQGYVEQLSKFTLKKFLLLVLFLDKSKLTKLIDHDPVLFNKDAPFKSSRSLLLTFSREFLKGEGDVTKHLSFLGYAVTHSQTALEEFDYAVKNIATDLRDGLRLTRVAELLMQKWNLSGQLRVPAISRLQKIHNVDVFLKALKDRGVCVGNDLDARHIVDGHREKTLALLWQLIFNFQVNVLLSEKQLKEEIHHLEQNKQLRSQLTAALAWAERDGGAVNCRRQSTDPNLDSERLRLLLKWCKTVCGLYGMKVDNFTVSFSDGRALCYLLHHYHPSLLPMGRIRQETTMTCNPGLQESDSEEEESLGPDAWTAGYSPASGVNRYLEQLKSNERENFRLLAEKVSELGGVPLMTKTADMSNTIPDEKVVITYVSYLCARLLDLRQETRAARVIQTTWRRRRLRLQLGRRQEAEKAAVVLQVHARAAMVRRRFLKMKKAAVQIQTAYRGHRSRKLVHRQHSSAMRIQAAFRAWKLGRVTRQRHVLLKQSVVAMQAIVRGNHARRLCRRMRAAKIVQATWRGYQARRRFVAVKAAVLTAQRAFRSARERGRFVRLRNAALMIQRAHRATSVCKFEREKFLLFRRSAVALQSFYRGQRDRRRARRIRAAVVIQSRVRAWIARGSYQRMRNAVVKIQAHARARIARQRYVAVEKAARVLQLRYRDLAAARKQREHYLELRSACVKIQAIYRGVSQRGAFLRQRKAAIVIETYTRMHLARTRYASLRAAVLAVQRRFRARLLGRKTADKFQEMKKAATKIQAALRRHKQRKDFVRTKRAVVVLQSYARRWLKRAEFVSLKRAAFVFQTRFRALVKARSERQAFHVKRGAVITLQAAARGYLTRQELRRRHHAATVVQAAFRARIARRRFLAIKNSADTIQRRFRAWHEARVVSAEYQRLRLAVVRIQSAVRAHRARQLAKTLRAVITVQAFFKGHRERKRYQATRRSIVKLQALFRGFIARTCFRKLRCAAVVIQRRLRARVLGDKQRGKFCAERRACVVIQSAARGWSRRKDYLRLKRAAVAVQRRRRALTLARELRKRYVNLRACALRLQAASRGWRARKVARCHRAARTIQTAYRMRKARREFQTYRQAVVKMQALTRANQQRASYVSLKNSAIVIQTRFRALLVSRQDFKEYHVMRGAAITIQSATRGFLARQRLRQMNASAAKIQSTFRGFVARRRYTSVKLAVLTLQLRYHAYVLGRGVANNFRKLRRAAVVVQAWYRGYRVRCATKRLRAAIRIQSAYRAFAARCRFTRQRSSAIVIQAAVRRQQTRGSFLRLRNAAMVLQRRFRAKLAAKRARAWYLIQRHACVNLQAAVRGWQQRRRYSNLRKAAVAVQRHFRARVLGAHARGEYQKLKAATIIVQSAYRAWKAREIVKRMRSARKIQSLYRMTVVRRRYLKMREASVFVQALWRGNRARSAYLSTRRSAVLMQRRLRANRQAKRHREQFLKTRAAAVAIQAFFRGQREREQTRRMKEEMARRETAACAIQRYYRGYLLMKTARLEYHFTRGAVITVQSHVRGFQARRFVQQIRAAVKIQAFCRATSARLKYAQLKRSVITVQALVRCHQTKRRFARLKAAVLAVQRRYRASEQAVTTRQRFVELRQACVVIQAAYRGFQARRRFGVVRRGVIAVQALVRMKHQQRNFTKLRDATVKMQRRVKSNMLTTRVRADFLTKKSAVLQIQVFYRGWKARCHARRLAAAVLIQRRLRALHEGIRVRQDFLRLRRAAVLVQAAFRGYRGRKHCAEVRAARVIQARFRGLLIKRRVEQQRQQRRAQLRRFSAAALHHLAATRIQRFYLRARAVAMARTEIKSVLRIQFWWRGVLQRQRFLSLRSSAVILQRSVRMRLHIRHQAATKIQSLGRVVLAKNHVKKMQASALLIQRVWRGYQARCHVTSVKVKRARRRVEAANAAATDAMKLCNRTRSALDYLLRCKNLTTIFDTLVNLEVVTRLSCVCCEQLVQDHALRVIYTVIRNCNRSLPHMEIIKYAISILINVAKWPPTFRAVYDQEDEVLATLLELLCNFRDKGPIFSKTCHLLMMLARDSQIRLEILGKPKAVEKIRGAFALTERKYKLEAKRNTVKTKCSANPAPLAPLTPCKSTPRKARRSNWSTMWQDHVNTTRDPLEAAKALVRSLEISV